MTFQFTNMSEVALTLSMLVEVAAGISDREHLGLLDTSQEAHPLLGVDILIMKVIQSFPALNNDGSIQWDPQISVCRKRPLSKG